MPPRCTAASAVPRDTRYNVGVMPAGQFVERLARFGYACKGIVYIIIGLLAAATIIGHGVWRVISGLADSERHGRDFKGLAMRAGSVIRGIFYGSIAIELLRRMIEHRSAGRGSDAQAKHWTARAMEQ